MDFKLTDEQELIVDSYREYMESENWETYFHECDEKHEYPLRWVKGLCELGFDQIMLPESHGGLGLEQPCVTLMAVYEILGKYGAPTYVLYQLPGFETIIREGTEEQIEAVMSTLGSGEQIWNSACTEPGAGSDVGALATTYKRENGKIYLNGTKTFITSSAGVKYLVIMAKNADDPGLAVARRIAESLRSAGFSGAATVWFFEVPKEDLLASRRVWGVAVQLQEQAPTVFARGFGIESLPVASKRVLVAEPFAGSVVWRPDRSGGEVFELASGAEPTALARRGFDRLDDGTAELEREVRAAVAAAGGPAERKGP